MTLTTLPRRRYTPWLTPLTRLPHFQDALGDKCPDLFIKRDDLLGLAMGGNKTRKLEFLVGDALAQGADTLITCGAIQSNHCRLTLAAAVTEGLHCRLILEERVPGTYDDQASGNNFLYQLLGAETISVLPNGSDLIQAMADEAELAKHDGRQPYCIVGGGSNEIGACGYVDCVNEIFSQLDTLNQSIDCIVCTSGSAGTHAGLLAGLRARSSSVPVVGISVMRDSESQTKRVHDLANRTLAYLGESARVSLADVTVNDSYIGPGYAMVSDKMIEAVTLMARTEGILLDPVYTGKACAGLIGLIRDTQFTANQRVLFLHTGGSPALFAYQDHFSNHSIQRQVFV